MPEQVRFDELGIPWIYPRGAVNPLTTKLVDKAEPLRFRIPAGERLIEDSDLLVDQIRAIDNKRLVDGPLLQCALPFMAQIDRCIAEVFGL